jgi:ubiquinone/menaquinone biosynthesis C-methylase UbiE
MPGTDPHRTRLLSTARGRVLDVGTETAKNLPLYSAAAEQVVGVEPDARRRERVLRRVPKARIPTELHEVAIARTPFSDGAFDTVVSMHALRCVNDPSAALAEFRRLVKPDGRLLFIEAAARRGPDPVSLIRAAGFVVTACDRFRKGAAGVAQPSRVVAA